MDTLENRSTFIDEQGNSYRIVHDKKLAEFVDQGPTVHAIMKQYPKETILGYEMINGFHCAVRTLFVNGKPGGKEYAYLPYGLIVKFEFTAPGGKRQMVQELYDIEVAEPDPALVRIPNGYAIANQPEK
jgi:hypothetical protein